MPIQPICSHCRSKRLECDGARPYCGTCTREILACNYDYDPKVRKSILPKGMACLPCRRDKRRCDGAKPTCTSCKKSPKRPDCRYEELPRFQPEKTGSMLVKRGTRRPKEKKPAKETFSAAQLDYAYWFNKIQNTHSWTAPIPHMAYDFWTSDPSAFQLSRISADDRNMMFRLLYLSYSLVRGNMFSSSKFQAMVLGDVSGDQVHPFFVLFAEFSGRHFYQVCRSQWLFWEAQGVLAHLMFRELMSMRAEDDPVSYIQAHWSMATGLMTAGSTTIARRHYQMALAAIREHDIRFVKSPPNPGVSASFSEFDHERAVLLGKIIHFESFLSLYMTGLPGARAWDDGNREAALAVSAESILHEIQASVSDLERQFRQELPLAYPVLLKICPLTLRTKTFLLCKDVRVCLHHLQNPNPNSGTVEFSQDLVGELQSHLHDIIDLANTYFGEGDQDGAANLRCNAITTMMNLLEMHRALARSEITSAVARQHSRSRCGELLSEIALTAQKVVVLHGKYLSSFIVYDTADETTAPDVTDIVSPLTVTSLLSIGGFAGTFMPLPSRTTCKNYSNPPEELIDLLINDPSEMTVEVNFNLASKTLWSSFVTNTLRATNNQSRVYVVPNEGIPQASPNLSAGSSNTPTP